VGQTFVISGIISLKGTVVSVYKDTLDKDNLDKPTLFGFSPSFYKDNYKTPLFRKNMGEVTILENLACPYRQKPR
jgi:hypothetical protein